MPASLLLLLTVASVPAEATFVVRTATGKEHRGAVQRIEDGGLLLGKGKGRSLAAGEWLSLRREGAVLPPLPTEEHLVLANGDRVPVQQLRLEDEKLFFRHRDLGDREVSVGLSAVALVWRLAPDGVVSAEQLRHRLLRGKRAQDVVLLRNGDTLEGTVNRLDRGEMAIESNKKVTAVRWTQVAAVALSTELLDRQDPRTRLIHAIVSPAAGEPGGRFTLTEVQCDGSVLEGKTTFGARLRVPLERLAALEPRGDKVTGLETLTPAEFVYSPYLDERWGLSVGTNVVGGDLRIGGSTYTRGLGVHATSRVRYVLPDKFQRFEATVGLDDQAGRGGEVRLRVLVDGKAADLGGKELLTQPGGPVTIQVELAGARELTLEVASGRRGPVRGAVNWVETRLVR
ncbi:MAG: NPCBM/NEW2 domain-containing protein [Gemmataceae bacterium]